VKNILKASMLLMLAGTMMGNQSCEQEKEQEQPRELRRRVQMGRIVAPPIQLPQGGTFDFQYVANAQMYDILKKTNSFSTATIDPAKVYDTAGLSQDEASQFNQCSDPDEDTASVQGKLLSKSVISQKAACMIDMPQGIVAGNILDFTLVSGGGISLKLSQIPFLPGASFSFKRYELSLAMRVMHPLQAGGISLGDRKVIATTSKESFGHDFGVDLQLNFNGFELGPSYYYKSPLRKVLDQGLTDAVNDLKNQWNTAEPWYAMVLRNCDKYIYINAGNKTDAGLMVGDIVRIQNVDYRWAGKACESQLMAAMDYIGGPVAYAKIVSVGDNMSAAVVLDKDPNYPYSPDQVIKPGARVYMEKLFVQPKTAKK
jgi:hypothetical protein